MNLLESKEFKEFLTLAKSNPNTLSVIVFGSYARGEQKENSDLDIAIFRKKGTVPADFPELSYKNKLFDIHFLDLLVDEIKFEIFSEGKVLVQKDHLTYKLMRRRFLHSYLDNYGFFKRSMEKMLSKI